MIKLVKFDPRHIKEIRPTAVFQAEPRSPEDYKSDIYADYDRAWTIIDDENNQILGCVGGFEIWRGVADCWCYFDEGIKKFPLGVTKEIRTILDVMQGNQKIHRVHGYVRADQLGALAWAKLLGFCVEGTLKAFGEDRTDYFMVARVKL